MKRSARKRRTVSSNLGSDADSSDSREGSQDLFSSHGSTGPILDDQIHMTLQLTESVWVQCDKPECQKWRRVPISQSNSLNDVWYCEMNPDIKRNSCAAAEEDVALYDKMAKKAGIKYVMSAFEVGSLVWAKMAGYCSWPALITLDPDYGMHVIQDKDGNPHSYHVEFLGKPHTHCWVAAKFVDVYGYKKQCKGSDFPLSPSVASKKKKIKRGRPKNQNISSKYGQKTKTSYKRTNIEDVIVEADFLLHMNYADRLGYSIFRYIPEEENRNTVLQCKEYPKTKKRGRKKGSSISSSHKSTTKSKDPLESVQQYLMREASISNVKKSNKSHDEITCNEQCVFDSPAQFSQSKLKFMNTLADKSKEEKFRIDVDMYKRNEAAFEHDVRRFMSRHGQQIRNTPVWHNVPVTLFQLYLSVNERGGFLQVTARKKWSDIYRELTEQQHVTTGAPVKKYYQQNLYPFELYITGKDYQHSFKSKKKGANLIKPAPSTSTMESMVKVKEISQDNVVILHDDHSSVTEDIERILNSLKEEDEVTSFHDWNQRKAGVKFHDDDTVTPTDQHGKSIPSEFQRSQSNVMVHEVTNDTDSECKLSELEQKIVHEMKALEDFDY